MYRNLFSHLRSYLESTYCMSCSHILYQPEFLRNSTLVQFNLSSLEKTGPPLCIFCRELTMVLPVLHLVVIDSFLSTNSYKYRTSPWQTTLKSLIIMLLHVLFLLGNFFYLHCLYLHVYLFSDKIYQHVFSCTDCTHSNFDDREMDN